MAKYILASYAIDKFQKLSDKKMKLSHSEFYRGLAHGYTRAADYISMMDYVDVEPVNRWVSVEDKLPETNGKYLCCYKDGTMEVVDFDNTVSKDGYFPFGWWDIYLDEFGNHLDDWNELKEIKYWQPLPKSPIEEQEETK